MNTSPIVATITVTRQMPHGILARVDGQTRLYPNRASLFRAAVELLDARLRDSPEKGP